MSATLHITARLKKNSGNGMKISGTLVAVNSAGIVFKAHSAVDASVSVETAGVYSFTLPAYGPNDGAAPNLVDSSGAQTINTLIAGTGGNDIIIPGSTTYICTSAIAIPAGKTLRAATGTSVTLKRSSAFAGNIIEILASNASLKNLTIDGNWAQRSAIEGAAAYGIMIANCSSPTIDHCEIINCPSVAVWAYNTNNLNIQYNQFTEDWCAIYLDGNNLSATGAITGNRFENTSAFKSIQGIEFINTKSLTLMHNTIGGFGTQSPTSHGFEGTWGNNIYFANCDGTHIENNTCNTPYWSSVVVGAGSTNTTVHHNNLIRGTQSTSSLWFEQISADVLTLTWNIMDGGMLAGDGGGNNMTMTNNILYAYTQGIDVSTFCKSATIADNAFIRLSGTDNGIFLWEKEDTATEVHVLNNTFVDFTVAIAINNLGGVGTVYGLTIQGNSFSNCASTISLLGSVTADPATCSIQSP